MRHVSVVGTFLSFILLDIMSRMVANRVARIGNVVLVNSAPIVASHCVGCTNHL